MLKCENEIVFVSFLKFTKIYLAFFENILYIGFIQYDIFS